MKIAKEEIAASALALAAIALASRFYNIIINDGDVSQRWHPVFVWLFGAILLAGTFLLYRKGSLDEPERNGRRERPLVFWPFLFAGTVAGLGFMVISTFVMLR